MTPRPLFRAVHPATVRSSTPLASIGGRLSELAVSGGRLFLATSSCPSDALAKQALALAYGGGSDAWRIVRSGDGAPHAIGLDGRRRMISLSTAGDHRAILLGDASEIGLDLETLDRVARNITPDDDWLAESERRLLARLSPSAQPLELACRWMLREAYGKATGLGLPGARRLPVLRPGKRDADWRCDLQRHGTLLFATVQSADRVPAQSVSWDLAHGSRPRLRAGAPLRLDR